MKKMFFILILIVCLSGCKSVTEENVDSDNQNVETNLPEQGSQDESKQESQQENIEVPSDLENKDKYDLEAKLKKAEEDSTVLEEKLLTDATIKQTDMNMLANDIYVIWDDLLNDMWKAIKSILDEEAFNTLLVEQREWITGKEEQIKQAREAYGTGSLAPFAGARKAAELTKVRVYELAEYLK